MEIKLFGKSLFEAKKSQGLAIYNSAIDTLEKSKFLIDFYKDVGNNPWSSSNSFSENILVQEMNPGTLVGASLEQTKKKEEPKKSEEKEKTPKEVYTLKMLNDTTFKIKIDPKYIDEQLESFKEKLGMIKAKEFDMNRGTIEIASMVSRFENRKKYIKNRDFYDEFPYTTTTKINELTKSHTYLKLGEISQFLADMPKEATDVMKAYSKKTEEICDKKPVFYIIANKKDFEKTEKRRDPILLAQSPFGHFWQILGAWDEEMLLIEEL